MLGQMYDYLLLLKSFHGVTEAFGLLTTYEQWRVCWLSSADGKTEARATATSGVTPVATPTLPTYTSTPMDLDTDDCDEPETNQDTPLQVQDHSASSYVASH